MSALAYQILLPSTECQLGIPIIFISDVLFIFITCFNTPMSYSTIKISKCRPCALLPVFRVAWTLPLCQPGRPVVAQDEKACSPQPSLRWASWGHSCIRMSTRCFCQHREKAPCRVAFLCVGIIYPSAIEL